MLPPNAPNRADCDTPPTLTVSHFVNPRSEGKLIGRLDNGLSDNTIRSSVDSVCRAPRLRGSQLIRVDVENLSANPLAVGLIFQAFLFLRSDQAMPIADFTVMQSHCASREDAGTGPLIVGQDSLVGHLDRPVLSSTSARRSRRNIHAKGRQ